ncbi:M48 family metallopeptidase [Microbispora sp. NPDC049633]|uniref:M48 family metallopeptidase n=1 Tax=Microbispora sp. NPDC049633 TaxID=3154355 RepID=UPI003422A723
MPGWLGNGALPVVAGVAAGVVAWLHGHREQAPMVIAGVVMIAVRMMPFAWPRRVRQAHVARRADHPELYAMVDEVARTLGVRRPSRVCFMAVAESAAFRLGPRRTELWIGLPYAMGFDRAELRGVIAFELALLEACRTRPLAALLELWASVPIRKDAVRAEVAAVVKALMLRADEAGCLVSDRRTIATALLRGALLPHSLDWFAGRYAAFLPGFGLFAVDLYQGWRWKVFEDDLPARLTPRYRELYAADPSRHGFMLDRIAELGAAPDEPLRPAEDPIVRALHPAVEERFARWLLRDHTAGRTVYWSVDFADMPFSVWDALVEQGHDSVLRAVAHLSGRPDPALDDLMEIVASGRIEELQWEHGEEPCTHPSPGVCALFPVLHRTLRMRGYTYVNALRHRELAGPDGNVVDVVRLAQAIERGDRPPQTLVPATAS